MNKVLLVGRIVRDPFVSITQTGIKNARITIAVNRISSKDQADFVPCTAWRQTAEFIEKYTFKGSLVSIEGKFTSSTYQNKEKQLVTNYDVLIDRIEILESKSISEIRNSQKIDTLEQEESVNTKNEIDSNVNQDETYNEENNNDSIPWDE